MKVRLGDIAAVIRSKNAGPFEITIDIIFADEVVFQAVAAAPEMSAPSLAKRLGVNVPEITNILTYSPARAIKINLLRRVSSGAVGDRDVYGAQQHVALIDYSVEIGSVEIGDAGNG
jgi:predicted amidohydrolase